MTMLDRMRRRKNILKWLLAVVVVGLSLYLIPVDWLQTQTAVGALPRETVASVDGHDLLAGEFQQRYVAQMQAYQQQFGGSMNAQLLRQLGVDQQVLTQMVDEQVAVLEAERQGIRVSDDELAQRIFAIPGHAGERPVHRRSALRAAAAPAAAAAHEGAVRGSLPPRHRGGAAAHRPHRLDGGVRRRARGRVPQAQREAEAAGGGAHRRQLPRQGVVERCRRGRVFRGAQGRVPRRRAARDQVPADRPRPGAAEDGGAAERRPALLQRQHPAVPDAGTDPRQPHPAEDRRQGRGGGPQACRGAAGPGEGRRRLRRAGDEGIGRRGVEGRRRRPRPLRPRPHGARVRNRGVCHAAGTDERSGALAVRVSHHPRDREEGGGNAGPRRGAGADSGTARAAAGRSAGVAARRTAAGPHQGSRRSDRSGRRAGADGAGVGLLPARRSGAGARQRPAGVGRGLHARRQRRQRRAARRSAARCSSPCRARRIRTCRSWRK